MSADKARSTLAVIPARGGSKRIPRKNIRPFRGVPLLVRAVELLRDSAMFERIIVSTDDDEIADVARGAGAEVPFRRPAALSSDAAATAPVVVHAIQALEDEHQSPQFVCCVYPAAVLARVDDFGRAFETLVQPAVDYVFTATSFSYPIQRALRMLPDGACEMIAPEHAGTRSQDLEPAYHDAGQFYWGRREAWLAQRPLFSAASRMLLVPHYRVQDIDTEEDWTRAELISEMLDARRDV